MKRLALLVGGALVLAVTLPWLLAPGYVFFTDFSWGPTPDVRWATNGGPVFAGVRAMGLLVGQEAAQKLFLVGVLALLYWAGWRIAKAATDDPSAPWVVAAFMLFSPFVYDRLGYGQVFILIGLACYAHGTASLLERVSKSAPMRSVIHAAAWWALGIQCAPHFLLICVPFGIAWAAFEITKRSSVGERRFPALIAAALIIFLTNANWLIPSSGGAGIRIPVFGMSDFEAFRTSGDTPWQASANVLTLTGFWGKDQHRYVDLTTRMGWGRAFLFLAPLMTLGISTAWVDPKRRRIAVVLLTASALAAFLAVGMAAPWSAAVTRALADHLPGYRGLRETQKWVALLVVSYAVLLAWGIERLRKIRAYSENRTAASVFLVAIAVAQAPYMLWGMAGKIRPVRHPADWTEAERITAPNKACKGDVAFAPFHLYMSYAWAKASTAELADRYFTCPVSGGTSMEWGPQRIAPESEIERWSQSKGSVPLPPRYAFVILAKENDWQNYAWFDAAPYLKLVLKGKTLNVYEVTR